MRSLICFLFLLLTPSLVLALDKKFNDDHFISDISFNKNEVGIFIGKGSWKSEYAYILDRENYQISKLTFEELKAKFPEIDLSHRDFLPNPTKKKFIASGKEIGYEYIDCKIFNESEAYRPLSLSTCSEIKIKIGNESFGIKSKFYYDQKLSDPVIFGNYLIFKIYLPAGITDRGKSYPAAVEGIVVFDVLKKAEVKNFTVGDSNAYSGSFTSLLKYDPLSHLLWIGNNYGLYGLNEKLEEKISCFFIHKTTFELKCTEADFINDHKWYQSELLDEKLTKKVKMTDHTTEMILRRECLEINRDLFAKYMSDPDPKKAENKLYVEVVKCVEKK